MQAQTSTTVRLLTKQALPANWFGLNGQNVTSGAVSWVDSNLMEKVPVLKPQMIRYPSFFSFWDWKEGWVVNSPLLPDKYADLERKPNYLENFKLVLDAAGASALFTLNLVTATLQDQIAMLRHADSIGIPVKYVELGNEFYISPNEVNGDGVEVVDSIYPTAREYGLVANEWIDTIHHYFPQAEVCVIGAWTDGSRGKKGTWNDSLRAVLHGREDAWSYHVYQPSSWFDTTETEEDLMAAEPDEMDDWMAQPFIAFDVLQESISRANAGKDAWITEFNLNDHFRPVQGMWGHGLFNAALSLLYLKDTLVAHSICHAMVGSALYGQYFTDSLGFVLSPEDDDFPSLPDPPITTPWSLTATGHAMKLLGEAQIGKTEYAEIDFPKGPMVTVIENYERDTVTYPGLLGAFFSGSQGSEAIIVNLTGSPFTLNSYKHFGNGTYTMVSSSPIGAVADADDVTISSGTVETTLTLLEYSITRISTGMIPANGPVIQIIASGSTEFCEGGSVQLDAGPGFASYLWSTGERTRKIWARQSGDYSVEVNTSNPTYAGEASIHVTVHPLPDQPDIAKSGPSEYCADRSTELFVKSEISDGSQFEWSNGELTDTISITATGDYYITVTDIHGCRSNSDSISITVNPLPLPTIVITGSTTFCDGGSVNLSALPEGQIYLWSQGQSTGSITVDKSAQVYVVVTDDHGCKGTSETVTVTEILPPNPTITRQGAATYCGGASPTTLSTISGYTYQWLADGITIDGATQQSYTPSVTGTYEVTIMDTNGCTRTSTNGKTITINTVPSPAISATLTNICNGETSLLEVNSVSGWIYQWLKNGNKINGATNTAYSAGKAATYSCKATIAVTGCTAVSNSIVITSNCRIGADGDYGPSKLELYPNPATDVVHVSIQLSDESAGRIFLVIRNSLGQVMNRQQVEVNGGGALAELELGKEFCPGVYFVTAHSDVQFLTGQLVVK